MRALHLLPLLSLLAATPAAAAIVSVADLNADLAKADQACAALDDQAQKTECFNVREREVWLKDSPESIATYDLFSIRRIQLINQLSSGLISWGEYNRDFNAAARRLVVYKNRTLPPR